MGFEILNGFGLTMRGKSAEVSTIACRFFSNLFEKTKYIVVLYKNKSVPHGEMKRHYCIRLWSVQSIPVRPMSPPPPQCLSADLPQEFFFKLILGAF
jgi:hypothetical protein